MRKPKKWQRGAALAAAGLSRDEMTIAVPGVLGLQYTENTGISFSLFGDSRLAMYLVIILTGLVMLAGGIFIALGKIERGAQLCGVTMILAGGFGNWFDRVTQGYVVDYFEFLFVRFAVFNFADVLITGGVVWLAGRLVFEETRRRKTVVMP